MLPPTGNEDGKRLHVGYSHAGYSRNRTQVPQRGGVQKHATCYCCGKTGHRAKDPKCSSNGKKCNECHKIGHFGRVCKSQIHAQSKNPTKNNNAKQIQFLNAEDSSEDEYIFALAKHAMNKTPVVIDGALPLRC